MQRRNRYALGKVEEIQALIDPLAYLGALTLGQPIPLVECDHQGPAAIEHLPQDGGVLLGKAFSGVNHEDHDLSLIDRLKGLDHAEFFDRLVNSRAAPHTGRVDQQVGPAIPFRLDFDGVAGGARLVKCEHSLFAQQAIDQRGLTDIGSTNNGNPAAIILAQLLLFILRRGEFQQIGIAILKVGNASAVGGGNGAGGESQRSEVGQGSLFIQAIDLVHDQQQRLA